jgi:hypothetical protein
MKTLTQTSRKLALALLVSAAASQAGAVQLVLDSVVDWNNNSASADPEYTPLAFDTSASDIIWSFDGATVTGAGTYSAELRISPLEQHHLFSHLMEDLSITLGGVATATSYECVEGTFGVAVGGHLCGQWEFGGNYLSESSISYSGSNVTRTLGGDDAAMGPAQQLSNFNLDGVGDDPLYPGDSWSWDGNTLQVVFSAYDGSRSTHMTFSAVPVPAAAWLFGSSLLGLVGLKRKRIES